MITEAQTAFQHFHTKIPLISHIVNRIYMTNIAITFIISVCFLAKTRNHTRMPVMAMNDLRPVIQLIQHFDHCFLEICKALSVIIVTIHGFTFKITLMFDKIEYNVIFDDRIQTNRYFVIVDRYRIFFLKIEILMVFLSNFLIQRQNDTHFMPFFY